MFDEDMHLTPEEREEAIATILRTNKHFDEMTPEAKNRAINAAASMNRRNKARLQIIAEAEARERASRAKPRRGDRKIKVEKTYRFDITDPQQANIVRMVMVHARNVQNGVNEILKQEFEAGREIPDGGVVRENIVPGSPLECACRAMPTKKMVGTIIWTVAAKWQAYANALRDHPDDPSIKLMLEEPKNMPDGEEPELAFRSGLCAVHNGMLIFPNGMGGISVPSDIPWGLQQDPRFSVGRVTLKHIGGDTYEAAATYVLVLEPKDAAN